MPLVGAARHEGIFGMENAEYPTMIRETGSIDQRFLAVTRQ